MTYKLQVNERGSWRDVLTNVEPHQEIAVMEAAVQLHTACGGTRFRIFDTRSQKVLSHLEGGCWNSRAYG
jgi:hypothetical protein